MGLPINKHSSIIKGLEDENLIPSVAIDYLINQFYKLIPEEGSDAIATAPDKDINTTDYLVEVLKLTSSTSHSQGCQ